MIAFPSLFAILHSDLRPWTRMSRRALAPLSPIGSGLTWTSDTHHSAVLPVLDCSVDTDADADCEDDAGEDSTSNEDLSTVEMPGLRRDRRHGLDHIGHDLRMAHSIFPFRSISARTSMDLHNYNIYYNICQYSIRRTASIHSIISNGYLLLRDSHYSFVNMFSLNLSNDATRI